MSVYKAVSNPGVQAGIDYATGQQGQIMDRKLLDGKMKGLYNNLYKNPESVGMINPNADIARANQAYDATATSTGDAALDGARRAKAVMTNQQQGGFQAQNQRLGLWQMIANMKNQNRQNRYASYDDLTGKIAGLYGQRDQMVAQTPWWQTALSIGMGGLSTAASGGFGGSAARGLAAV